MIDFPDLPDFLRRDPPSEEERRRLAKRVADYRLRRIKNPPKRVKKTTRLLGMSAAQMRGKPR